MFPARVSPAPRVNPFNFETRIPLRTLFDFFFLKIYTRHIFTLCPCVEFFVYKPFQKTVDEYNTRPKTLRYCNEIHRPARVFNNIHTGKNLPFEYFLTRNFSSAQLSSLFSWRNEEFFSHSLHNPSNAQSLSNPFVL